MGKSFFGGIFGKKSPANEENKTEATDVSEVSADILPEPHEEQSEQVSGDPVDTNSENEIEKPPVEEKKTGFFARIKRGLTKSSSQLSNGVASIFTKKKLDSTTLEELEDLLISADLGITAATRITSALSKNRYNKEISTDEIKSVLAEEISASLAPCEKPLEINPTHSPHVILMTGVNGAGKTTTIGKLAQKFMDEGKSVMLAAGDTFRAAAIEQLQAWGQRAGVPVVAGKVGADAAGLAYDALNRAIEEKTDVLMIDTAGRLQNRSELMDELAKIVRVIQKLDPSAPHDVLLVLDATVGQNALSQTEIFRQVAGVTGLVMTKLDGTARGGVLVALADKFQLPIHFIGLGESADDLHQFSAQAFADALADTQSSPEQAK